MQLVQPNDLGSGKVWIKPPANWFKCNVGYSWSKRNQFAGGGWVLRDEFGNVLVHSMRTFSGIRSKEDASLRCLLWALESMASHRVDNIILSVQDKALVGCVSRPAAWPSFKAQSLALANSLRPFLSWKLELEFESANRGANLIAQSVTGDLRCQSYVAVGSPSWLSSVFVEEARVHSV